MGLLDSFLQGASNSAASTVSAPVDGIAWLLRKAGLPIPTNPVGGSDWLAQQGLTREPENRNMGLLGEAIGGVAPMVAAAKAPQIAKGLLQMEANAMAPRTMNPQTGAIVWHGSPHKFDKFDASKIGTGEGAQAYVHGLYLAESPDVAMKYQPRDTKLESKIMRRYSAAEHQQNYPAMQVYEDFGLNKTPEEVLSSIHEAGYSPADLKEALKAHKIASKEYASQSAGALYKVDLPDEHIAKMLDWDAPLNKQPENVMAFAKQALAPEISNASKVADGWGDLSAPYDALGELTGRDLISRLRPNLDATLQNITGGGGPEVSNALKQAGIPGIRYLDGGSRGTGAGTSNFVVFPGNEGLLSILERNGQPLAKPFNPQVSLKPDSSWMQAKTDNGLVGGHIRDGALHINHADLAESARGKGEGISLYKSLIDDALSKGLKVFSDSTVELPAVRVYESLKKRGYDVNRLAGGVLEDGSVYGAGASNPAFEVSFKP